MPVGCRPASGLKQQVGYQQKRRVRGPLGDELPVPNCNGCHTVTVVPPASNLNSCAGLHTSILDHRERSHGSTAKSAGHADDDLAPAGTGLKHAAQRRGHATFGNADGSGCSPPPPAGRLSAGTTCPGFRVHPGRSPRKPSSRGDLLISIVCRTACASRCSRCRTPSPD